MACGVSFIKCAFIFYILLLGVLSAATTIFAAWLLIEILGYSHFLSPNVVSGPPISLLLGGILLLPLIVLLGFRTFSQKSQALAIVFWVAISVTAILSLALAVWCMILRAGLYERLEVDLLKATKPAERNELERAQWDFLQRSLRCCGTHGTIDYMPSGTLPMSCCDVTENICAHTYKLGCLKALNTYGSTKMVQVALGGAILSIFMLIGIYAGCSYSSLLKKTSDIPKTNPHEDVPLTVKRKIFLKDHEFNHV